MNILIVGRSQYSGSWAMRGQQIGAALGARVTTAPSGDDWEWADVCILVKHAGLMFASFAHQYGVPIIWDVLDVWKQPQQNAMTVEDGKALIHNLKAAIQPSVIIGATKAMAYDIGGVYVPHHCRLGLVQTPPRKAVRIVAYDGSERYLGAWRARLEAACRERGWRFVINPPELTDADILVAFRDGEWDGPLCRRWKSGVKYVNATCSGRPILTQSNEAFWEMEISGEELSGYDAIEGSFESWISKERRTECAYIASLWAPQFTVQAIAERYYRPLLTALAKGSPCAA